MARKYYKKRTYYKRNKWSSNILDIDAGLSVPAASSSGTGIDFANTTTLVTNPVQDINSVSQIFTVKNVELSFNLEDASGSGSALNRLTAYIVFVPQGMAVGEDYVKQHPEYIMAMRYFGNCESSTSGTRNPLKVKTRLSRKLNTGDNIILFLSGKNYSTSNVSYIIHGVVRWWTKAN